MALHGIGGSTFFYGNQYSGDGTLSGTVALPSDLYARNLIITGTGILETNGFAIYCEILEIQSGGVIRNNGANGTNASLSTRGFGGAGAP